MIVSKKQIIHKIIKARFGIYELADSKEKDV